MGKSKRADRAAEGPVELDGDVAVAVGGQPQAEGQPQGVAPTGWLAFGARAEHEGALMADVRPGVGQVVMDILDTTAYPDESFEGIECHHVLEHLLPSDAVMAAANLYRMLKPSGILEVSVPDMGALARSLLDGPLTMREAVLTNIYSPSPEPAQQHRWGYTSETFARLLREAGFVEFLVVQRFEPHEIRVRCKKA